MEKVKEEKAPEIVEAPNNEDADIEAQADLNANPNADDIKKMIDDVRFTARFSKPYNFEGKEYKELDLSGLQNLGTTDLEYIDRVMAGMRHVIMPDRWNDTLYCKHVAMRATNKPVEFFNGLNAKDMLEVAGVVRLYFLLG